MYKKAQSVNLNNAASIALILVLVAMLAGAGSIVLDSFQNTDSSKGSYSFADSNSVTLLNGTAVYFGDVDTRGVNATLCASVAVYNGTNALDITENVSIDNNRCVATLQTDVTYNNTAKQINYTVTLTTYDYSFNNSEDGLLSISNLSDQMPTVGTIIGVVLIIVVVVSGFAVFLKGRGGL